MINILAQRLSKYSFNGLLKTANKLTPNLVSTEDILYFGYGANLGIDRFKTKGMNASLVGQGVVKDYEMYFGLPCEYKGKGYADIRANKGYEVWGSLFKMNRFSLLLLDILEWVPFSFYKKIKVNVLVDGKEYQNAIAYKACSPNQNLSPSSQYKNYILAKSKEFNFPDEYINKLDSIESKDHFELDPGFRLSNPAKRRIFEKQLQWVYLKHDLLREKFSRLLP